MLDAQRAVVLGEFSAWKPSPLDRGFNLKTVVAHLRSVTKTPILTGLPHGHVPTTVMLPIGARVTLATQGREALKLLWDTSAVEKVDSERQLAQYRELLGR